MAWFKRIALFAMVNILVMVTISIVINLLGLRGGVTAYGIDYPTLMGFCLVWGMGGAFISLLLSRQMAKWMQGVRVIAPDSLNSSERALLQTVYRLASKAGLNKMPEVGVYDSPEVNAFATGPTRNRSLVAVSSGLLQRMNADEMEGVLAHEVAHVANGDMVTMTLVQGVVNAFAMFLARIAAFAAATAFGRSDERESGGGMNHLVYMICTIVFDIAFTILGSIVVAWFSRLREYRADSGGATLAGKGKMVAALRSLERMYGNPERVEEGGPAPALATLKISSRKGWLGLFSTHPDLSDRIARLQQAPGI